MRVLLIEDDTMLGKALVRGLKRNGLTVDWTRNGPDGHAALRRCESPCSTSDCRA
jgi:DNA-binding response OmpR family regulator